MKKEKVNQLPLGLYRIFWKEKYGGGTSLAAVGFFANGDRWITPTNWTSVNVFRKGKTIVRDVYDNSTWLQIAYVELLASNSTERSRIYK